MTNDMTHLEVHQFMLGYQDEHGKPPTLREITSEIEGLNHASSTRYTVRILLSMGLVEETDPEGMTRRYKAIIRDEGERSPATAIQVPQT
jgi:hypothetical protein